MINPCFAEDEIRAFLSECMPNLADRPFSYSAMCWDADSPSGGHFLIDRHPELPNLIVAGGASAHAFKVPLSPPALRCLYSPFLCSFSPPLAHRSRIFSRTSSTRSSRRSGAGARARSASRTLRVRQSQCSTLAISRGGDTRRSCDGEGGLCGFRYVVVETWTAVESFTIF